MNWKGRGRMWLLLDVMNCKLCVGKQYRCEAMHFLFSNILMPVETEKVEDYRGR